VGLHQFVKFSQLKVNFVLKINKKNESLLLAVKPKFHNINRQRGKNNNENNTTILLPLGTHPFAHTVSTMGYS